jgi:hypothetical protein
VPAAIGNIRNAGRPHEAWNLLAFYTRQDGVAFEKSVKAGADRLSDTMIRIITETVPHRGFVATGFEASERDP